MKHSNTDVHRKTAKRSRHKNKDTQKQEEEMQPRRMENEERAYVAASRRGDRSLEARYQSALLASQVHKQRTGRPLRITHKTVYEEEMYEEEDDDLLLTPRPSSLSSSSSSSSPRSFYRRRAISQIDAYIAALIAYRAGATPLINVFNPDCCGPLLIWRPAGDAGQADMEQMPSIPPDCGCSCQGNLTEEMQPAGQNATLLPELGNGAAQLNLARDAAVAAETATACFPAELATAPTDRAVASLTQTVSSDSSISLLGCDPNSLVESMLDGTKQGKEWSDLRFEDFLVDTDYQGLWDLAQAGI